MESRIPYLLKHTISVAVDGNLEDVQVLDLVAPSKKALRKTYRLQQYMARAMLGSQKMFSDIKDSNVEAPPPAEEEDGDGPKFDSKAVMAVLLSSDVDIEVCIGEFEKLALLGGVEVNGTSINQIQLDKLDPDDVEGLFANYVANFTMSSVLGTFANG